MNVEAKYYDKLSDDKVQCKLCPHNCVIKDGKTGLCLIRKNENGTLYQTSYNEVSSLALDPIEKKPLYHFYPSSNILSIGTNGCNLKCPFCQNWQIVTTITHREKINPDILKEIATMNHSIGIAYTYNEPFIWYEFILDCAKVFKNAGLKNVFVTNGQINREPLMELAPYIDAANIDLKGFTNDFYKWINGDLTTTLNTIEYLFKNGSHIELTNLVVTNKNDNSDTFDDMCRWIASISSDIPLHISRYFPNYKLNEPPTPLETLKNFYEIAKKYLKYVYIGNVQIEDATDTLCPKCNHLLVKRDFYLTKCHIKEPVCPECSEKLYFVL
ncbi:AmmeMemoRadiSam system radical SAM enzyme [Deferribacter autotrophicus]|uniref:AmmeMemoRadiSam system radical SAM enzyme n=1 Tax=Deferribacter autotrophicus TaxID=500465 RepID=A0A5A8F4Y4_9BACT|nr:AmmeMemoRadiSam system radical SAM enzyme [Deferribacter autotrophicus]KAA0256878.1 AmmeMemoRadiSam system radical SAM enzyme [Deferribacter autotrophicus]